MKKLLYLFLTVLIVACSGEDSNNDGNNNNQSSCNGDTLVYLADNGVTIKACDDVNVGDTGIINGVTYTVVDEAMLRAMVENEQDVTKVVTTKVTDMSGLLYINNNTSSPFNQPIGSWDVSNVTNMRFMFYRAYLFNQEIVNWDVSNVTDMVGMFQTATSFNQVIGNWDVSNVTDMEFMFYEADSFNRPIGNWDVSNVISMEEMFSRNTIYTAAFNQPLNNWDVSNVIDMTLMFYRAADYNQDLSSWNVNNVTLCGGFSLNATSWTLPQPNFTNCTP